MFETSVVRARVAQRRFSLLSVSLAAHSLVIIAVLAASIASISFPKAPPHESTVFYQEAPPPPPPAAPRQPVQQPPAQVHPATVDNVIPHLAVTPMPLTPLTIPSSIPIVPSTSNDIGSSIGNPLTPGTGTSNVGDPNGVDNIGQMASNATPAADTVFHPGANVKPASVIFRVEPQYPQVALRTRMAGTVVVKCIVDRNGNVRDAEVVTSSFAAFNEPALNALQQWRFAPGSFRGKPVDTWFELTIRFQPR